MPRRALRRARPLTAATAVLTALLPLAACGTDNNPPSTSTSASNAAPASGPASGTAIACNGSGQLLGAGSTAQANAMDIWKTTFGSACPSVTVTYGGGGSGAGVQQFNQGKVAFAGSDAPLSSTDIEASKQACPGGVGIDLPMVAGLVSIAYNVDGVDKLVLDGPTLAKIFNGKITKWNDPAIAALNPGVTLPDAAVQAVHRADDSGTTANFTAYLTAASKGAWPYQPGKTWPGQSGQSANGSAGVAAQVKQVKNSIGYIELSYAQSNDLKAAAISTGAPQPVEATAQNAATTIGKAQMNGTGSDLALTLDYGTQEPGAYPIVLVTYEIVCDKGNKAATLPALKSFLTYTISGPAQQAISTKGYVPLPQEVASKVQAVIPTLS